VSRRIVIFGTGGMGREAAAWVADADGGHGLRGFLNDDASTHGTRVADLPVLGGREWLDHDDHRAVEVVTAIGSPAARARVVRHLDAVGVGLVGIVHPSAIVGPRVTIADGAIICPGVLLTCDVRVGRAAIINYGARVGHDGDIGASAFVGPGAHLAGNVTVGDEVDVGIGASVIQGVTIGARSVVGAGAVVIRDVDPGTTVVGVPARPLRRDG
jgi:sugar O-acyltransferase (sialic acid O-acetyltransferase NeuD family)